MKHFLISFLMLCSLPCFAQIKVPADFAFSTPFYEAENKYVVFSPKPADDYLALGVPYFDPTAGYSYRYLGNLKVANGKLNFYPADPNSSLIARWENLDLKVAVLSPSRVKEFKLAPEPEFLKDYQTDKLDTDYLMDKLSAQNGAGYPQLALPKLEKLQKEGYRSATIYFELAFAYNALNQFSKAEAAVDEAEKNGFRDELLIKEMHYALLHQNKVLPAAEYLEKNFKNFKSKSYKSESILNQLITFDNNKDLKNTQKWIAIYKTEIGEDQYKPRVDEIEKRLKDTK